jgi:hypothetical protein
MRTSRRLGLCVAFALTASCRDGSEPDDLVSTVRVSPATVSSSGAWALFDRSLDSGFAPDSNALSATFDRQEELTAIRVYGSAPYRLRVTGPDGSSIGFTATDLSKLGAGWNLIPSSTLISTDKVEIRFEALGSGGKVPEVELWALSHDSSTVARDPSASELADGLVAFQAQSASAELLPGECSDFQVELTRSPSQFGKVCRARKFECLTDS